MFPGFVEALLPTGPHYSNGKERGRDGLRVEAGRRVRTLTLASEAGSENRTPGPQPPAGPTV